MMISPLRAVAAPMACKSCWLASLVGRTGALSGLALGPQPPRRRRPTCTGCLRVHTRTDGLHDRDLVHGGGRALLGLFRTKTLGLSADRLDVRDADEAQDLLEI